MRKTFKVLPGVKLNIGRKSISTTIGKRGLSLNTGSNGTFLNIGIPGTGIRYRKKLLGVKNKAIQQTKHFNNSQPHIQEHQDNVIKGAVILGFIIGGIIFLTFGSFLWSFVPVFLIPMLCSIPDNSKHQK